MDSKGLYCCDLCDKSYNSRSGRLRHINRDHQNIRHTCPNCSKVYKRKDYLHEHSKKCSTIATSTNTSQSDLLEDITDLISQEAILLPSLSNISVDTDTDTDLLDFLLGPTDRDSTPPAETPVLAPACPESNDIVIIAQAHELNIPQSTLVSSTIKIGESTITAFLTPATVTKFGAGAPEIN